MLSAWLLMVMLQFVGGGTAIGSIVEQLIFDAIQVALAYLLLAVGTNLAHRCLFWSFVAGVAGSLLGAMVAIPAILVVQGVDRSVQPIVGPDAVPTGILIFWLFYCLLTAVVFVIFAVMVHRGTKRLAGQRPPAV